MTEGIPLANLIDLRRNLLLVLIAVVLLAGCATPPAEPSARAEFEQANDPLEPMNRRIFAVNQIVDKLLFKPVAEAYRTVLPKLIRTTVRNMLENLQEPVIMADNVMQGELHRAGVSFNRFLFNSTVGLAGMIDFAGQHGLPRGNGDFGQTLFSWGIGEGPYLALPILGPSSPRDAFGMAVDAYMDPFRYILTQADPDASTLEDPNVARTVVAGIDKRAETIDEINAVEKNSVDFYAQIRSLYSTAHLRRLPGPSTRSKISTRTPAAAEDALLDRSAGNGR
jgi:phospholipid-binding lipoprotein MlaA